MCNRFPTPVHTVIRRSAVLLATLAAALTLGIVYLEVLCTQIWCWVTGLGSAANQASLGGPVMLCNSEHNCCDLQFV